MMLKHWADMLALVVWVTFAVIGLTSLLSDGVYLEPETVEQLVYHILPLVAFIQLFVIGGGFIEGLIKSPDKRRAFATIAPLIMCAALIAWINPEGLTEIMPYFLVCVVAYYVLIRIVKKIVAYHFANKGADDADKQ